MNTQTIPSLPAHCPPLNTMYMYLTKGCNLACRHCWVAPRYQPDGGTGGHMDVSTFERALDEAIPLGLKSVKLTGGEPTLNPYFVQFLEAMKRRDISCFMESNGVLITRELARYMKEESSMYFISISLDGASAASHDAFRGVPGSFEKTMACLEYLIEVGYKPQIIMSLHEGNIPEIETLVKRADEMGVASVKFNLINSSGRGTGMIRRGQASRTAELIEIGNWVEKTLQKEVSLSLHYSWPVAFQTVRRMVTGSLGTCGIFNILGILSDGTMAMCGIGSEEPELSYGRVGVDAMQDVWFNHPMLRALRKDIPHHFEGVCGKCIVRETCLGSCVAENYHREKKLMSSFWFCQEAYDEGLFPASRLEL